MLFNSYVFILLFLPVCLLGYFSLNHLKKYKFALLYLLAMSLWFYGYFNPSYLPIIIGSVLINYCSTKLIERTVCLSIRKIELVLTLALNLGILFYYKYYDFFIININRIFASDYTLLHLVLPLGISFFTFQQISFVIDAYRGEMKLYGFLEYASFVLYFPQLIAGPIVTHDELIPQFLDVSRKRFLWDNFAQGIYIFVLGLGKKVLLADVFGQAVNWGYGNIVDLDTTNAVLVMLSYTFQVYFDFSGYCDMAIGLGKMMNIDLPLNFNSPYKALSITEFWKRWHITLTRFFTKYIYIPLGGNRKGTFITYCNIMIVFLLSGLWHGAGWSFVVWGALHGVLQIMERIFRKLLGRLHEAFKWIVTFALINISWIFFRAESLHTALRMIKRILLVRTGVINQNLTDAFFSPEVEFFFNSVLDTQFLKLYPQIMPCVYMVGAICLVLGSANAYEKMQGLKLTWYSMLMVSVLFVWCIISFSGISTFLYFNF